MFMAIIRSQEALLFQKYHRFIKGKVLDFGCGEGFFAELVFGKGKINIGLDLLTNQRVQEAKKRKIYKKIILYDGGVIPYPNNYFDSVVSNCVLEHIPKLQYSLKEIYRVLKPEGYFLTSVMTDRWEDYQFGSKSLGKPYLDFMRKTQDHHNLFSQDKWQNYLKKTGFKIQFIDGYLYRKSAYYLGLFHFLSIGSLISYKLFNKWVLFSISFLNKIKTRLIKAMIIDEKNSNLASALFFVLKK